MGNGKKYLKLVFFKKKNLYNWKINKNILQTFQERISKMPDLEKELERLKRENKNLRDTIGNKLQLEEEVFHLKTRLEKHERSQDDNVALHTQIKLLDNELQEYKAVATEHCAANTLVTSTALRIRIEEILRKDVILMSEKSSAKNDKDTAALHVQEYKNQLESCMKTNASLQTSLKYHKASMHRVQKKLGLVARERDCYKQLIENYEKDLTSKKKLILYLITQNNPHLMFSFKCIF